MDDDLKRYLDSIQKAIREENSAALAETRRLFDDSTQAIKREFETSTEAIRREFEVSTETTKREFEVSTKAIRREFEVSTETIKRHFDVSTEEVKGQVQLLAEIVAHLNEKINAIDIATNANVDRNAADTQAMIKFSHAELHRRVSTLEARHDALEEGFAELQARVDRLESSTH